MKKSFSYPIIFMIIITAIFTSVLAFLNYKTKDQIAYNQETDLRKTILYIFDIETENLGKMKPEEIEKVFKENIKETTNKDNKKIYLLEENNQVKAYAFPVGGTALWGSVEGYAAISSDLKTLLGIDFISHSETPGLGGRISEEEFKSQFRGLDLTDSLGEKFLIYRPSPSGNIDAIAGATQTSQSVAEFLNIDISNFIKNRKEMSN